MERLQRIARIIVCIIAGTGLGVQTRSAQVITQICATMYRHSHVAALQREAETMRQQYEADAEAEAGGDSGPRQQRDYSLKEGQTLHIALPDKVWGTPQPLR